MSKILITGGAGFIGSQLGWRLQTEGHEVLLLDDMSFGNQDNLEIDGRPFGTFIKTDIRSKTVGKYFKAVDYVFHFAGLSSLPVCQENPYYAVDVNVAGTANVLEAARLNNVKRVVFSSTSAVYENNKHFPSQESDEVAPDLLYATTKLQAELLCRSFSHLYGLEIAIVRYYNVYGPHQDFKRKSPPMTGYIIRELLASRQPMLFSSGEQKRDYIYVDDVNNLNILCMTHPKAAGEIFNAASGTAASVKEIYSYLKDALQSDIEPRFNPAQQYWDAYPTLFKSEHPLNKQRLEKEVNKYTLGSNKKAKQLLGWKPTISLQEGMRRSAEFALQHAHV